MRSIPAFFLALTVALSPAHAAPDAQRRAEELFQKSETLYQAGDFRGAIALLEEANRLSPHPVLVYNLARAHESLGERDEAIAYYRRYLELDPDAADKGAVTARIDTLSKENAPPPPITPPPIEPGTGGQPSETSGGPSPVPWIVAGAGALGVGAGAVLGGLALSRHADAEAPSTDGAETERLAASADDLALGASIAFVAGGVLCGAGLVWGIVDVATTGESTTAWVEVRPGELVVHGRF